MIRTFFEFLLSRSHDDGTPPHGWFNRLLLRDEGLNHFDTEAQQLDALLRSSAAEQRHAMANNEEVAVLTFPPQRQASSSLADVKKNSRHSLAWLSGLAAAALVLITLAPSWFRPTLPAVQAGEFSHQLTVVPGEVLRLLTSAAKISQAQLPQLSPLTNLTLPVLPAWEDVALHVESPVRQEINFWQEGWQELKSRLPGAEEEIK